MTNAQKKFLQTNLRWLANQSYYLGCMSLVASVMNYLVGEVFPKRQLSLWAAIAMLGALYIAKPTLPVAALEPPKFLLSLKIVILAAASTASIFELFNTIETFWKINFIQALFLYAMAGGLDITATRLINFKNPTAIDMLELPLFGNAQKKAWIERLKLCVSVCKKIAKPFSLVSIMTYLIRTEGSAPKNMIDFISLNTVMRFGMLGFLWELVDNQFAFLGVLYGVFWLQTFSDWIGISILRDIENYSFRLTIVIVLLGLALNEMSEFIRRSVSLNDEIRERLVNIWNKEQLRRTIPNGRQFGSEVFCVAHGVLPPDVQNFLQRHAEEVREPLDTPVQAQSFGRYFRLKAS